MTGARVRASTASLPAITDMKLPLTSREITAEWLTNALAFRFPGVQVTGAEIADVINGTSTKIRVRVRYDRAGLDAGLPPTLIVKGGFEAHSPSMKDMYLNETRFYRDVQPYIDIHTPRCYYAGSDPGSHQSIVILEDLRARNVTFCDPLRRTAISSSSSTRTASRPNQSTRPGRRASAPRPSTTIRCDCSARIPPRPRPV